MATPDLAPERNSTPRGRSHLRATLFLFAALLALGAHAHAQYNSGFEADEFDASAEGVLLEGQGDFFAEADDFGMFVYTYEGNTLGIPSHPDGGDQFIGLDSGESTDGFRHAVRHALEFEPLDGVWVFEYDACVSVTSSTATIWATPFGAFCLEPLSTTAGSPADETAVFLGPQFARGDLSDECHPWFRSYDADGTIDFRPIPDEVEYEDFGTFTFDTWYRIRVVVDYDANRIEQVRFTDIETDEVTEHEPSTWFMGGGSDGGEAPNGFSFRTGGARTITAFDNLEIQRDCNENDISDVEELALRTSFDCDLDGILDECEGIASIEAGRREAADPDASDLFGDALAAHGGVVVVGARGDDEAGLNVGAAYVFRHDGQDWVEEAKLLPSDGEIFAEFGFAVAVEEDLILVGARRADVDGTMDAGAAYLFRYGTGGWTEEAKLVHETPGEDDEFGRAVALNGAIAAVGVPFDDAADTDAGSVLLFRQDGGSWTFEAQLFGSEPIAAGYFGRALSFSGTELAVGAPREEGAEDSSGVAYLFALVGSEWVEQERLFPTDGASFDEYGSALVLDGDDLLVGARRRMVNTVPGAGVVYAYRRDGASWPQIDVLTSIGLGVDGNFGCSVDASGGFAIVGASGERAAAGIAYTFQLNSVDWVALRPMLPLVSDAGDGFGSSVASVTHALYAGAPNQSDSTSAAGAFYVAFTPDCDRNGVPDACDIAEGVAADEDENGVPDGCECLLSLGLLDADPEDCARRFLRGDANADGAVGGLADGVFIAKWAFLGGPRPPCMDAADCDANNAVSGLTDVVYLLRWNFLSGAAPPAPGTIECGVDPDQDQKLDCAETSEGCR